MAIYYIDLSAATNGDGAEGTPFNALTNLPTLVAGDTVRLKRGSYQRMSAKYTLTASGTATAWITFEAYGEGDLPILESVNSSTGCFDAVSRSYILVKNIKFVGPVSSTNENSYGIRFNGVGAFNYIDNCVFEYLGLGIDLSGGFNKTNVRITNCTCNYNNDDGIRIWSGSGTYTWDTIEIVNCTAMYNGRRNASNGNGLNALVQSGHTGSSFNNITVKGCNFSNNNKDGISFINGSVAWATIIAAGNTTPPTQTYNGLEISNCIVNNNKEAGMHLLGIGPGTKVPFLVQSNQVKYNGSTTTIGNIWTGGCKSGVISRNVCIGALTNGTTVGDGQGIFDDQWNDGMTVCFNYVSSNVFRNGNPDYSAYGIGIFRATNSTHVGNVIHNCRYGYVIGTVQGSTAPVMANIVIENNTFIDTEKIVFSFWTDTPSNSITLKKNVILRAPRDVEAHTVTSGVQIWDQNIAYACATKYTGNNVDANAWDHTKPVTDITKEGFPKLGGNLYRTGTYTKRQTAINGSANNPPSIGAYEYVAPRGVR